MKIIPGKRLKKGNMSCHYISVKQLKPVYGNPCGVVANVLNCDIVVIESELQSCYYVHFQTNTLEKGLNMVIPKAIDLIIIPLLFFYKDDFGIE